MLQVQQNGEAWYVNPKDGKRYYMKDGEVAYHIMRYLSLGITNKDLDTIDSDVIYIENSNLTSEIPKTTSAEEIKIIDSTSKYKEALLEQIDSNIDALEQLNAY